MSEKVPNSDSLPHMLEQCEESLKEMRTLGLPPAPYYFERVAILARKSNDLEFEISFLQRFIHEAESFYAGKQSGTIADIRKGPRYQAIVKRLKKAKSLFRSHHA